MAAPYRACAGSARRPLLQMRLRDILLMSRPPLLWEEGNAPRTQELQHPWYSSTMKGSSQESLEIRYGTDSSAQLILEVAKAASSHLELAEVLESLIVALKPTIRFDAIAVFVIEGDSVRLHSLHVG